MRQIGCALVPAVILFANPLCAGAMLMVTDVSGKVLLDGRTPVKLIDGIEVHKTLTLGPGGRLALLNLVTGVETVFKGPCRFRLDGEGRPQGARPALIRPVAVAQGPLRLKQESLVPAGILMRGAEATAEGPRLEVAPLGPVVLEASPLLSWKDPGSCTSTRFRLYDDAGAILHEAKVEGTSFQLPVLLPGKSYTWVLECGVSGRAPRMASGCIKVLDEVARLQLEKVRPAAGAAFADRVLYAALLDDMGLLKEGRAMWQALAKERPADKRLGDLAKR